MAELRVLHVLSTLNIGSGVANFVMNYYRQIANYDIQFDFLVFNDVENSFKSEVERLGGRIYYIEKPTLNVAVYKSKVKEFFKAHSAGGGGKQFTFMKFLCKNLL